MNGSAPTPNDHADILDSLLVDYVNGGLPAALELLVETHIAMNNKSARTVDLLLHVGGYLLEESEPVSMSEGAFEAVMAEIERTKPVQASALQDNNDPQFSAHLPRPIADYMPDLECTQSWRRVGIGLSEHQLDFGQTKGKATIYRIAPGVAVPTHSHKGSEITLVLAGGFSDENGSYVPGDIAIQHAGSVHQPVADDDGECIVFAVNEDSIELTGPLGRMLNLLVR